MTHALPCHSNFIIPGAWRASPFEFFRASNLSDAGEITSIDNVVTVDFSGRCVGRTPKEQSSWRSIAAERLAALRQYEAGWDGTDSQPVSPNALNRAGRLLELAFDSVEFPAPPAAVPCSDGSLQLEWWLTDVSFELVIEADSSVSAIAENRLSSEEVEVQGEAAINLLLQWAKRLTADKLIPSD